ncbi:MAG: hypothetical protein Q8M26_08675 [Pseudolabrys sp.]|nr:hypothetical protein [Pseudolabrys sp.]
MGVACIAYRNLADSALLLASSQELLAPVANLQRPDVARRWRSTEANTASFVADLFAASSLDTVALIGTTMSAAGTCRIRISATDSTGVAGELYDSGATLVSADYNQAIALLATPVTGRYIRIDLADPGAEYLEAGRLFVGPRSQFVINYSYGWSVTTVDRSAAKDTRGGQTQVWRDNLYRVFDVAFESLSASERYGFIEEIERANAQKDDVLFVADADSSSLARDSIWGLIQTPSPIVQPHFDRFSKTYKIKERL